MFNGYGWVLLIIVAAVVLFLASRSGGGSVERQKRRMWEQADRLVKENIFREDDVAIENFMRAMILANDAGDGLLASEAASHLGDIYMKRERYDEARSAYERALKFKKEPGWYDDKPNFEALLQRCWVEANQKAGDKNGRR
jgi:tetratricopeptide (TPR) repeat protein